MFDGIVGAMKDAQTRENSRYEFGMRQKSS
jgi:hypothetical protein